MTPPAPSGSYFEEGFVMISIFSIIDALIFPTSPLLPEPVLPDFFPSIRTVTFSSPDKEIVPSMLTSMFGICRKTSVPEPPDNARFSPTLNIFLSIFCIYSILPPNTSIPSILKETIANLIIPISCRFFPPLLE